MAKTVAEEHKELYHYTTGIGLEGILKSQQLRATNIAYLNDAEEHTGYFDRRLPQLLENIVRKIITDIKKRPEGIERIEKWGGEAKAFDIAEQLRKSIKGVTLDFNNPYVASFCAPPKAPDSGLLSQWRGYGTDGGYAIVFDTVQFDQLLQSEQNAFHYQFIYWGDVEYYDEDTPEKAKLPETIEREGIVQSGLHAFLSTGKQEAFDQNQLYEAIAILACSHKHHGFAEEQEVRIVALPVNDSVREEAIRQGEGRPRKPICFEMRNGTARPYIMLFESTHGQKSPKLPIKKIIVGPHLDRLHRKKSVELLLKQYEVEAEVVVSEIPYIGR